MMRNVLIFVALLALARPLNAVESACSHVVGYVCHVLDPGLSLISLPLNSQYATAAEFGAAQSGNVDAVFYWDTTIQHWVGAADLGGYWDGDFPIEAGTSLWINVVTAYSLIDLGDLPPILPVFNLVEGLNSIAIPLDRSDLGLASELCTEIGNSSAAYYWDQTQALWIAAMKIDGYWISDFPLSIGMAVMVHTSGGGIWPAGSRIISGGSK